MSRYRYVESQPDPNENIVPIRCSQFLCEGDGRVPIVFEDHALQWYDDDDRHVAEMPYHWNTKDSDMTFGQETEAVFKNPCQGCIAVFNFSITFYQVEESIDPRLSTDDTEIPMPIVDDEGHIDPYKVEHIERLPNVFQYRLSRDGPVYTQVNPMEFNWYVMGIPNSDTYFQCIIPADPFEKIPPDFQLINPYRSWMIQRTVDQYSPNDKITLDIRQPYLPEERWAIVPCHITYNHFRFL